MPYYPGKASSVEIDTVEMSLADIEFSHNGEIIDIINFLSQGWNHTLDGPHKIDVSGNGPYSGAVGFKKGDTVEIVITVAVGLAFTFDIMISEFKLGGGVKTAWIMSFTAASNGPVTIAY